MVVTACKTDPDAGARGVSLIVVETATPGFERGRNLDKIGMKAQDTGGCSSTRCASPPAICWERRGAASP
ncbi:hypothetical protein AB5I41_08520 [Sphingomonas sp. MMS24-JH45]